jgi:PilZ domain
VLANLTLALFRASQSSVTVMSALAAARPSNSERRRTNRVPVEVFGRYMLQNRQDFPCKTIDISPGGVLICGPVYGAVGERVIAYLDHLGRLEGVITRLVPDGFAMSVSATARKKDKVAAQLTWLANRKALGLPEDRRHERVTPKNTRGTLRLPDGRELLARVIDVSMSGAAFSCDEKLPMGTAVVLGSIGGKIVRAFDGGIAMEFARPLKDDQLTSDISFA